MREIKFRGKRVDNREWIYGSLIKMDKSAGQTFIFPYFERASSLSCKNIVASRMISVDIETVGQYTGLKDKNGVEIYEGDIVKVEDNYNHGLSFSGTIGFENASFVIIDDIVTHYRWMDYSVEVIGNIHDNPKLLEGSD